LKYLLVGGCILIEILRGVLGFLDVFPAQKDENAFLPVCLSRGGVGKYGTVINMPFLFIVNIAPILFYAFAYVELYKQYKKVAATHGSSSSLAEIKKRLNSHVSNTIFVLFLRNFSANMIYFLFR